jgi:thiol-disulfide isomerase/thioredoxin
MHGFALGPLVVPSNLLALLIAIIVAAVVARSVAGLNRTRVAGVVMDMLLAAFVAARLVFVALWFDRYLDNAWGWLDVRDGGFTVWAGVLSGAMVGAWHAWRKPELRKPLGYGLFAGVALWLLTPDLFHFGNGVPLQSLPAAKLEALDGTPAAPVVLVSGKPTVINLWATWCPPCRRELPAMAAARKERPDIHFILADQGESAQIVRDFLSQEKLPADGVVVDSTGSLGKASGAFGFPTTLFYDAKGRLVSSHVGGLSSASLAATLADLSPAPH